MERANLYETDKERQLHLRAVETVAKDIGRAVSDVMTVYESELGQLKQSARVKDFLPVLVSQRVKTIFRHEWH